MHLPQESKKRLLHRLKITRGHLTKVIQMLEDDSYCIDILHQSQAVQSALKETDAVLLENHLKNCVSSQLKEGKTDQAIIEVMEVFRKKK